MKLYNFDKIICLNLEKRKDRKSSCVDIFKNLGLDVEFFNGIDGSLLPNTGKIKKGHMGCCLSHRCIFEKILENNWNTTLILEDDVEFHPDVHQLFEQFYNEVPVDWQMLYFGGNHCKTTQIMVSEHVHKLYQTFTTHCYAIKKDIIPILLEEFNEKNIYNLEVDVHLTSIQKKQPCYGFVPHLAWQRSDYSDIEKCVVDYKFLEAP